MSKSIEHISKEILSKIDNSPPIFKIQKIQGFHGSGFEISSTIGHGIRHFSSPASPFQELMFNLATEKINLEKGKFEWTVDHQLLEQHVANFLTQAYVSNSDKMSKRQRFVTYSKVHATISAGMNADAASIIEIYNYIAPHADSANVESNENSSIIIKDDKHKKNYLFLINLIRKKYEESR